MNIFKTYTTRVITLIVGTILILGTNNQTVVAATNLILNPSLESESSTPGLPEFWLQGGYGNNLRSYTYPVLGSNSAKAARVQIENYVDGDAKWYFSDTAVTGNESYYYSGQYRSDTNLDLYVRYNHGNCAEVSTDCSYEHLATYGPAATWTSFQVPFVIPANTTSITIFHSISNNGWLEVDNLNLFYETPATITDQVPNHSMEEGEASADITPKAWQKIAWGSNNSTFEYLNNDAHDGSKSVKISVNNFIDGDAKWFYAPQPAVIGDYQFSAWYKATADTHAAIQYTKNDGSIFYAELPRPEFKDGNWHQYKTPFSIPYGVSTYSVFFYVTGNGWLISDDYHVTAYNYIGFNRPLITITFDDGEETNITTILPLLQSLGIKSTQCYSTSFIKDNPNMITDVLAFRNAGHEICSHGVTHPDLTTLTSAQVDAELANAKTYLQEITGQPISSFASPYGLYNSSVLNQIKQYYNLHRTVDAGYNSQDSLNMYQLRVQNILNTTTLAEFQGWVNKAIADKTWLILLYHKVDSSNIGPYDTYTTDFQAQMNWLSKSGITIKRLDEARSEVQGLSSNPPNVTICPTGKHLVGSFCLADFKKTNFTPLKAFPAPKYGSNLISFYQISTSSFNGKK
jgi:peptidoglycan/xylan/chitin deacetylase (PgdA/CDA1 family)